MQRSIRRGERPSHMEVQIAGTKGKDKAPIPPESAMGGEKKPGRAHSNPKVEAPRLIVRQRAPSRMRKGC